MAFASKKMQNDADPKIKTEDGEQRDSWRSKLGIPQGPGEPQKKKHNDQVYFEGVEVSLAHG